MTLAWGLIPPAQLPPAGLVDELNQRGGLRDELFVDVGYGVIAYHKQGPVSYELSDRRGMATSSFMALGPDLLCLLINAVTGDGGPCFGDSGGPGVPQGLEPHRFRDRRRGPPVPSHEPQLPSGRPVGPNVPCRLRRAPMRRGRKE